MFCLIYNTILFPGNTAFESLQSLQLSLSLSITISADPVQDQSFRQCWAKQDIQDRAQSGKKADWRILQRGLRGMKLCVHVSARVCVGVHVFSILLLSEWP